MAESKEVNIDFKVTYEGLAELQAALEAVGNAFEKGLTVKFETVNKEDK